jgi:hypothetical protein
VKASTSPDKQAQAKTQTVQAKTTTPSFFGNSNVGSSAGAAPSVVSSTS